jgi:hypothetical protein
MVVAKAVLRAYQKKGRRRGKNGEETEPDDETPQLSASDVFAIVTFAVLFEVLRGYIAATLWNGPIRKAMEKKMELPQLTYFQAWAIAFFISGC